MYGGAICDNRSARSGAGVSVHEGSFNMYGGTISSNITQGAGGGVFLAGGTFSMYGGTISNNSALYPGNDVYIISGAFNVYGGTISNASTNETGVYCRSGRMHYSNSANITDIIDKESGIDTLTVTFNVENGLWVDETSDAKTITIIGESPLKLWETDIPKVGNNPSDQYAEGSWDVTPSEDTVITENSTYTCTYGETNSLRVGGTRVSRTKTPVGSDSSAKKKENTLTVKVKNPSVKASKIKQKKQVIKVSKVFTIKNAQGTVSFKKKSGDKKLSINSKTGAITVKKGAKKGIHKIKVAVTAAGNENYEAITKTVTVKIKVK